MTRATPMAMILVAALMTAACNVGNNDIAEEPPKLDKPMAPGASFTDLPPLEPPVEQQASPERKP